jgi:hypothetical protein
MAELLKRELSQPYIQQMASGDTIPLLKEVLVELTIGFALLI